MRLRPYFPSDGGFVADWIGSEEDHIKWSAGRIIYGFTGEQLSARLSEAQHAWGDMSFTAVTDDGHPVGFFSMNINYEDNSAFLMRIIVDGSRRGQGLGTQMLTLAAKYAFEVAGCDLIRLIVFDENIGAVKCYEKLGFVTDYKPEDFVWNGHSYSRTRLVLHKN